MTYNEGQGDVPAEAADAPGEDAAGPEPMPPEGAQSDLTQQLADARGALEDMERKYLYAAAELQNSKRRMQQELAGRMQFANEQLLADLLPLLDNFRRAIESTPPEADAAGVLAGVRMILQQLEGLLHSYDVEQIAAEPGTDFDPAVHEAVERLDAEPRLQGKVIEEVARGYTFRGRLLRAAKVRAGALAGEGESLAEPTSATEQATAGEEGPGKDRSQGGNDAGETN
ncbi:MAG: nucleotide exchange factor GrpE [Armatimonadota bacterium]|jgi:molecular chaperone GrpE